MALEETADDAITFGAPSGSVAIDIYLAVGAITGDQARRQLVDAAAAQIALKSAVASNPIAAAALPPLDRIEQVDAQARQAWPNDLGVLAAAETLPDRTPDEVAALWQHLRQARLSLDTGIAS